MIKSKVIELENIGFYDEQNHSDWRRLEASARIQDDAKEGVELEVSIGSTKISIPVGDILTCLGELGIDVREWIS